MLAGSLLCGHAAGAAGPAIVVLGDSLSSGYGLDGAPSWVTLLEHRLAEQGFEYEVVNASIAGDTSAGGLSRLPRLLETYAPAIVVVELGGNDGLRGQPVASLRSNLVAMLEMIAANGAQAVLAGIQIPPNYGPQYTQQFTGLYASLAEEFEIPFIEFFMDGVALNAQLMQRDRTHPNADGQPILLDNVWPVLQALLQQKIG